MYRYLATNTLLIEAEIQDIWGIFKNHPGGRFRHVNSEDGRTVILIWFDSGELSCLLEEERGMEECHENQTRV
ncbi:hypothetical protein E2C01_047601 [Portunus trituberculatus]|uniref:Uncharacterized protein n=1 Tax=Portunus trituberculatus TaxID=210409 RepID=A0A5B7G8Z7_PORTR|nr:hypothetical protein [Portunus trituberculatus]